MDVVLWNEEQFAEQLMERIRQKMGAGYTVSMIERSKINQPMQKGIVIKALGDKASPVVYVDDLYERYRIGEGMETLTDDVCAIYHKPLPFSASDMRQILQWEQVRDRLRLILIPAESNEELLADVVHRNVLDLAAFVCLDFPGSDGAAGFVRVRADMLGLWKQDDDTVYGIARENMLRSEWNVQDMADLLQELMQQETFPVLDEMMDDTQRGQLMILTNTKKSYGAVYMIFPEIMDQIVEDLRKGVYILPSSVHEVMLVDEYGRGNPTELRTIVRDVNDSLVLPEEILSDHVYYYSREHGLEIAA